MTAHPTTHAPARHATSPVSQPLAARRRAWWPTDAVLAFDFSAGLYMAGGTAYAGFTSVPGITVDRATPAWALTPFDIPVAAGPHQPLIVPLRGLIHEPARTRLNPQAIAASTFGIGANSTVAPVTTTLPDGSTGTAYRIQFPAIGNTFANLTTALSSGTHSHQIWVRDNSAGISQQFALGAGTWPQVYIATQQWKRFAVTQQATGISATISNGFDTFATDVLVVWPDVQAGAIGSPILAPGATATRDAAVIELTSVSSLPGLTLDHSFTATFEDGSTTTLTASGATLTIPVAAQPYRSIIG
ncbi:hypothetical protein [Pyruvatibacter sp.]|uniref:hypothetical protein n=1 Tax=Pyruvatibacter sp. TaxID=1981328 RepID=UPI0032EE770A